MERSATAIWKGSLKEGRGLITTKGRVLLNVPFNFATRFKDEGGTNPEELIAAAHASCYSMALSFELEKENYKLQSVHTTAIVSLENLNNTWTVSRSHLEAGAEIPDITEAKFLELADRAKRNCPISRLLNAEISLNAKLWGIERMEEARQPYGENDANTNH